jgi:hypothetical protein
VPTHRAARARSSARIVETEIGLNVSATRLPKTQNASQVNGRRRACYGLRGLRAMRGSVLEALIPGEGAQAPLGVSHGGRGNLHPGAVKPEKFLPPANGIAADAQTLGKLPAAQGGLRLRWHEM